MPSTIGYRQDDVFEAFFLFTDRFSCKRRLESAISGDSFNAVGEDLLPADIPPRVRHP